jgi:hypothetical protein
MVEKIKNGIDRKKFLLYNINENFMEEVYRYGKYGWNPYRC